ncbi:PAS domain-containing sensor histidine kinase [Halotia branconii]|uniref:histidine kinase n=1 Tax=Halotia branconii CENA392 TaxID=1539056 RepID=A0AAJ6NRB1_9CYAN|nr:PAS domain-containing sensor histidine kinase [Halotia branconii]WGV25160.1 PAS domain-containing sensor histidine kinase [Halotia branconii CENA392]
MGLSPTFADEIVELRMEKWFDELNDAVEHTQQEVSKLQKEDILWLNEVRFRTLVETTDAIIFIIKGSKLSYINPAVELLTGYTKKELLTGFDIDQLIKNKERRHLQNKNSEYQEINILTKDGTERWLACTVAMFDFEGTPVEMIAGIDVTDYKQAESGFHQALKQVKQLSEQRANFVSMACHQLRTPLNVVSVSNSLLQKRIDELTIAKTRSLVDHIQTGVEKLSLILNDILLFAQAEAAKVNFDVKPLDLIQFCHELVAQVQKSSAENVINFVSQCNSLSANVDQELLERILKNLLDNAIKYSSTGSAVNLQLAYKDEKVIFQIIDRGIGILAADRQRLFEPFYRGNNIKNISGTGLGLSIVKVLVDLHGGQIAIESEVGVGTTVTVMLPS